MYRDFFSARDCAELKQFVGALASQAVCLIPVATKGSSVRWEKMPQSQRETSRDPSTLPSAPVLAQFLTRRGHHMPSGTLPVIVC